MSIVRVMGEAKMAIHTTWHDQDVIALRFERGWTWGDLRAAIKQADSMIISREQPVHLLIDIRQAGGRVTG